MKLLGIDVGGSGIKGAIVDTKTGQLTSERIRIPTPQPATPKAITKSLVKFVKHFNGNLLLAYHSRQLLKMARPCIAVT